MNRNERAQTGLIRSVCQRIRKTHRQTPHRPSSDQIQPKPNPHRHAPLRTQPNDAANVSLPIPDAIVNEQPRCRGRLHGGVRRVVGGGFLLVSPAGVKNMTSPRSPRPRTAKTQEFRGIRPRWTPREAPSCMESCAAVKPFYGRISSRLVMPCRTCSAAAPRHRRRSDQAASASRPLIARPSAPAVTRTASPSFTVPSRIRPASGFCRLRWITRFSGRAPYTGS
jgi:hypothetical protein